MLEPTKMSQTTTLHRFFTFSRGVTKDHVDALDQLVDKIDSAKLGKRSVSSSS